MVRLLEKVGQRPWGIAASADGRVLVTANGPSKDVSLVDAATGVVRTRVPVGGTAWGVLVTEGR